MMAENLTPKQQRALESYILDGNAAKAARAGGVARQTFYEWLKHPAFQAELTRLQDESIKNMGRRVLSLGERAAQTLEDALKEDQPMTTRLRAAALVYDRGALLADLARVVERLEALEGARNDERL